jgi:hypothetical protein
VADYEPPLEPSERHRVRAFHADLTTADGAWITVEASEQVAALSQEEAVDPRQWTDRPDVVVYLWRLDCP